MVDRFALREKQLRTLTNEIKNDIKTIYKDNCFKGYVCFNLSCKPKRFDAVCIHYDTLFLRDDDGYDYHIDNINDINELLEVLMCMYHIV